MQQVNGPTSQMRLNIAVSMITAHPTLMQVVKGVHAPVFSDPLDQVRAEILRKIMNADRAVRNTLTFYVKREGAY